MPTFRLTIEYEGTRYHGWQEQQNARSVAGEIKQALREIVPVVELGGAGRTDAGVHALAQCAHLRLRERVDPEPFRMDLNDRLPSDIHVTSVVPVGDDFHARHSARTRSYLYQISRRRTAFAKRYVWWVKQSFRLDRMAEGAACFEGRHDFALFCERPAEQQSTLVHVERVEVVSSGALILVRLVASHFLWKMVRRIVGALVRTGTGDIDPKGLAELLEPRSGSAREKPAAWTAPASGLFLERVLYDGDAPLSALAPVMFVPAEEEARLPAKPGAGRTRRRTVR